MRKPDRALHEITRRVIRGRLTAEPGTTIAAAEAMESSCADLFRILEMAMGPAGLHALVTRAIEITARDYPWLAAVKPGKDAECAFTGLAEASGRLDVKDAVEGYAALLASIVWLLITFIGEDLTLRIVRHAWPKISFSRLSEGSRND